ncbi:MAG: ATP-binding protein [Coriobacteriia bacterium]|nr:ATP-binding protein [Coriobacteriia bacterium]
MVSALVVTLVGGVWLYREQERTLRAQAENELETIAELKSAEIARWRGERLADADRLAAAPGARELVIHWLAEPSDENLEPVVQTLRSLRHDDRYADVMLVSTEGEMLVAASGDAIELQPDALKSLREALASGEPVLSELHGDESGHDPHLDVLTPISASDEPDAQAIAAVLLRIDVDQFLFPLIQSWPTPSETAETLLVEREGDDVLFLNDLRHADDTALELREPLDSTDRPAVKAVLGERGIVEGPDYRGREVLAYISEIPETPWLMISKVDVAEAFAAWQVRSRYIIGLVVIMAGLVLAAPALVVQRMHASEIKRDNERLEELVAERTADLHQIADELAISNERLEATVEELQSTNEELQATSEELMATTEELQQMNDELQYTGEELATANEGLAAASDAKSRFLRSVSHEFRTPLNSIIGFSGLMSKGLAGDVNSEQRHQLELIERSGQHLLALINDVLDLSRIEAGQVQLEIHRTDLNELVSALVESMRPDAERKGLDFIFKPADDLPAARSYRSDARRIRQIVLNLLGNAAKFTETGSVTARVFRHSPGMIGISIEDTGPGIPEEDRERVFDEFVQSSHVSGSAQLGTGLGLAISANLARLLGGTLTVESTVGRGSTFTLVLPERPDLPH